MTLRMNFAAGGENPDIGTFSPIVLKNSVAGRFLR